MTGLRKRTGLSLCGTAIAALIVAFSGFSSYFTHHQHFVECVPVKLVADFPTFAATLLGSLGHDPSQQDQSGLVTSSSSSSYLTNDQSDDELDDSPQLAKADSPSRYSSKGAMPVDYELDIMEKIQSMGSNASTAGQSANTTTDDDETTITTSATSDEVSPSSNATTPRSNGTHGAKSSGSDSSTVLTLIGGSKKSHIIRLPNGQSFQFCDELIELSCRDENAVCKMGACVCKPGFFLHRQSGQCQSISDLLKNCENDYQCQAFDVDLVCDTKSHERSFCDCAEGLYFDQETYSCIPCHRNTFVLATNNKELIKKLNQTQTDTSTNSTITATPETNSTSSNATTSPSTTTTTTTTTVAPLARGPTLRPCKPIDLAKLNYRRRKQQHQVPYNSLYDQSNRGSSSLSTTSISSAPTSTSYHHSSSDPFRIKTPLEVFMGAIMLFTLLTVAWFFLQRMFHDCRVILRSLRNPDFTGQCPDGTGGAPSHLTSIAPNSRPGSQLYLDPAGQAVARLLSNDGYNSSLAGIYQRDLAGVMVQHLAANLSPSSTSHALAATNGSLPRGDNEINLYPLTISSQQSRSAAAAAAAQLLLSPSHPAIAILRAAAASANQNNHLDYNQTSLLNSMLDPPPKYEEAIAQSEANQPSSYVPQQHHDNQISSSRASDENDEHRDNEDHEQAEPNRDEPQYTTTGNSDDDATNIDQQVVERNNDDEAIGTENASLGDSSQPPPYQSSADTQNISRTSTSTTSSSGPSEAEQTNSRRQSSARRKVTRRSRRGRGSTNRSSQQQANQDSDDTLTESH